MPGKNLLTLGGERLIERAIRIAFEAGCENVAVSTDYIPGVDFDLGDATWITRPDVLAGPLVSKWEVYRWAVASWEALGAEASRIVDVDVTRPLRTAKTVRQVIASLRGIDRGPSDTHPVVMSVAKGDKHPAFDILRWGRDGLTVHDDSQAVARQQLPPAWVHAGCYGMTRAALFARTAIWDGPVWGVEADRVESFDIDDELDWNIVQALEVAYARPR